MLTRLRVQGFKNLLDVDVRFGPFTCIAGFNGAGKSNIFDAIRFLHLLAKHPIMEAVQLLREAQGRSPEPRSLFSAFGEFRAPEIRLTANLIVDRDAQDDFGISAEAAISTVQYTVAFRLGEEEKPERLELIEETLIPISLEKSRKDIGFESSKEFVGTIIRGRRTVPFISTHVVEGKPQIRVHQEGHGGRKVPAPKSSRTVLSGLSSSDFPTLLAVHREMESWQTLLLEPSAMRAPSYYTDPRRIDYRGANVSSAIERLRKSETKPGQIYSRIENRLSDLIDDVQEIRVFDDEKAETLTLEVKEASGVFHAARSLSDGTLRFIVLATMAIDSDATGLICLEEPENGIHPERIRPMVELLRDIACDPEYGIGPDNPMRQVIVNTHSPAVIENVGVSDLIFVENENAVLNGSSGQIAAVLVPHRSWRARFTDSPFFLAPGHMHPYFDALKGKLPAQLALDFDS